MHEAFRPLGELRALRDPVLIAAFSGWNDNGGSAVATLAYLIEQWEASELGEIDPQPFYDFTVQRPRVYLKDGEREIDWPQNRIHVAHPPGADRDFLLLAGSEPHLKWRTFTEIIAELMREVGASTSVTLGAQPAPVPHTRPVPVTLSASHPDFEELFGLKAPASRYQGPTGIVGVLNLHQRSLSWNNASLWAQVPHYLTIGPNPSVALSLVHLIDYGFHTSTPLDAMQQRIEQFDAQVREALAQSPDAEGYVQGLEEQYDASRPALPAADDAPTGEPLPRTEEIMEGLERFLRENRGDGD